MDHETTTWDFSTLPVAAPLREHFAACLAEGCRPSGTWRSAATAETAYRQLLRFAQTLQRSSSPPLRPEDLRPAHLAAFHLVVGRKSRPLGSLKNALRRTGDSYSDEFRAALKVPHGPRSSSSREGYSPKEVKRVLAAARADIRVARARIRRHLAHRDRWLRGEIDSEAEPTAWALGALLDEVARTGDLPRKGRRGSPDDAVIRQAGLRTGTEALGLLFLGAGETLAFQILLVGLTGQNAGTVGRAPAHHHRTGNDVGAVAIVDLLKPRRGKSRSHMAVPIQDTPRWLPLPAQPLTAGRKELLTPLGVFLLLGELGRPARDLVRSDRLFAWYAHSGGRGRGRGIRLKPPEGHNPAWVRRHGLRTDDGAALALDFDRLRLSFVQEHNEPVAHTRETLHKDYQVKDRADLSRYQRVVADTLAERVREARETARLAYLTAEDLEQARKDPQPVADRLGVNVRTLKRLLSGRLDTVVAACKDNTNGPYTPGRACQASFLLCTDCPCAVALPHHLTVQVAAHDAILDRRSETTPLDWAERYGLAWSRLRDILDKQPHGTVDQARERVTEEERTLVERLLNRRLDA
ncbi:hypothetical protein [Geodermatophilus sp. CPCC 205761]|uniref:hypothetical protein n=1 Tax=Geodermatophilus sp. CPCC 205761 TaxID=2936597 RepID=UPI003EEADD21